MNAGLTSQQVSAEKRSARARLEKDITKALPGVVFRKHSASLGNARVHIDYRLIRASNGEACGWPTAFVAKMDSNSLQVSSRSFNEAPWMANGATPDDIVVAIQSFA